MGNTFAFISVAFIVIIVAIFGIQTSMPNSSPFYSFTNSTLAMINNASLNKNGAVFVSFDSFKNLYRISLRKKNNPNILNIFKGSKNNFWIATNSGLFLSKDGGLTWNNFVSISNAISSTSNITAITPLSNSGKDFAVSILKNNIGYVYLTYNEFFDLHKLVSFNNEAPSAMFKLKNILYMGMPNGQLIRYDINKKYARIIQSFKSSILKIKSSPFGYIYIKLKSGKLLKAKTFLEKFKPIHIPEYSLYSKLTGNTKIDEFGWDNNGNMYILSQSKILISKNNGKTFKFIKTIPLLGKKIDTMFVYKDIIGVTSENNMLTSADEGKNWHIRNIDKYANKVSNVSKISFVAGRAFLQ